MQNGLYAVLRKQWETRKTNLHSYGRNSGVQGIYQEVKGPMNDNWLRLSHLGAIFKNSKTGIMDSIQAGVLMEVTSCSVVLDHRLKFLTKNSHVYKYDGL